MTVNHSLRLFQIVSKYIPPDESRELVNEVEAVVRNQLQMETNSLATKYELFQAKDELKKDIHNLRDELKNDIHVLRDELKNDIHVLRDELKNDIHVLRDELKNDIHVLRDELKNDIHNLRDDLKTLEIRMEAGFKDQLKWIIMLMLGFSSLIIAVIKFM